MKGSNKAESNINNRPKNGGAGDTPGALFPRLHVKETRKNGPRGPPRNKMALYEQFTIPSHRFQQPTPQLQQQQLQHQQIQQQNGVAPPFMPQAFAGGYYLPYYMAPPMAYQPMNVVLQSQANFEGECDQGDMQRVPGGHGGESNSNNNLLRVSSLQSKSGSPKAKPNKGGKDYQQEDFAVPTYTLKRIALPQQQQNQQQQQTNNTSAGNSTVCTAVEAPNKSGNSKRSRDALPSIQIEASSSGNNNNNSNSNTAHVDENFNFSPSNSCESNEGTGGIDNQSDNEHRQSPPEEPAEASGDSETSILENSLQGFPELSSQDILAAVGDEKFWKMRKAMQRQQGIFQKQLFELHRLTKVQQLMAAAGLGDREEKKQQQQQQQQQQEHHQPQQQEQLKQQQRQQQQQHKTSTEQVTKKPKENNTKASPGEVSKQPERVTCAEESPPRVERNPTPATTLAPPPPAEAQYEYRCYPLQNNMGYPSYPSFPPVNPHQWYAPVPVQFPYQQPFPAPAPAVNIYTSPYGPVFPPMPFVPFACDQRHNVLPPQGHHWQPPPQPPPPLNYFTDPGLQWREHVSSSGGQACKESAHVQPKDFQSQAGSSSAGFNLIQGSSSASKEKESNAQRSQQQQQQQQQRLVGRFSEGKQASSSAGKSSPYARPSGFHAVNSDGGTSKSQGAGSRIIKVTPKAAMVTPESAAEILQSIRRERPER